MKKLLLKTLYDDIFPEHSPRIAKGYRDAPQQIEHAEQLLEVFLRTGCHNGFRYVDVLLDGNTADGEVGAATHALHNSVGRCEYHRSFLEMIVLQVEVRVGLSACHHEQAGFGQLVYLPFV